MYMCDAMKEVTKSHLKYDIAFRKTSFTSLNPAYSFIVSYKSFSKINNWRLLDIYEGYKSFNHFMERSIWLIGQDIDVEFQ